MGEPQIMRAHPTSEEVMEAGMTANHDGKPLMWRAPQLWRLDWRCGGPRYCWACAQDAGSLFGKSLWTLETYPTHTSP